MTTYTLGSYDDVAVTNETLPPANESALGNCEYILSNRVYLRGAAITTSDTVEALKIPAGSILCGAWVDVIVADTAATDLDLGWGGANAQLIEAMTFATTGIKGPGKYGSRNALLAGGTGATGGNTYFSSADTLDLSADTMTTTTSTSGATVDVYAKVIKPRGFRSDSAAYKSE